VAGTRQLPMRASAFADTLTVVGSNCQAWK
jgi:hypothetical protein